MTVLLIAVGVVVFQLVFAICVGKFLKRVSPPAPSDVLERERSL